MDAQFSSFIFENNMPCWPSEKASSNCLMFYALQNSYDPTSKVVPIAESIFSLLDDYSRIRISKSLSRSVLEKNEMVFLRACKQLVLESSSSLSTSAEFENVLALINTFNEANSHLKTQWEQLNKLVVGKMELRGNILRATRNRRKQCLGPRLTMQDNSASMQSSSLSAVIKQVLQEMDFFEFDEYLQECGSLCVETRRGDSGNRKRLDQRMLSSDIYPRDIVLSAWNFCQDSSSAFKTRCITIGTMFQAINEVSTDAGLSIGRSLGNLNIHPTGNDGLYAAFILEVMHRVFQFAHRSLLAFDGSNSKPSINETYALLFELHKLACWEVGNLICLHEEGEQDCNVTLVQNNRVLYEAISESLVSTLSLERECTTLPIIITVSIAYIAKNYHEDDRISTSLSPEGDILYLDSISNLFPPNYVDTMAAIAELCPSPKIIYSVYTLIRAIVIIFGEVNSQNEHSRHSTNHLLLLVVQALEPLHSICPSLLCKMILEILCHALHAKAVDTSVKSDLNLRLGPEISFLSKVTCFGNNRIPISLLLDLSLPIRSMKLRTVVTSFQECFQDENGCAFILQAILFLFICGNSRDDVSNWLQKEAIRAPLRALNLANMCIIVISGYIKLDDTHLAALDLHITAELVKGFQVVLTNVLDGLERMPESVIVGFSESLRLAFSVISTQIFPFYHQMTIHQQNGNKGILQISREKTNSTTYMPSLSEILNDKAQDAICDNFFWEVIENHEKSLLLALSTYGEAAILELFNTISLAKSVNQVLQNFPQHASISDFSWFMNQIINRLICTRCLAKDESLTKLANNFIAKTSYFIELLKTCGTSISTSACCNLVFTPMESQLILPRIPSVPTGIRKISALQFDLIISNCSIQREESIFNRMFLNNGLTCEDWCSLTFTLVHVMSSIVHEQYFHGHLAQSMIDSTFLNVVKNHREKIIFPAIVHALQWHLKQLAFSCFEDTHAADSFRYAIACMEICAVCFDFLRFSELLHMVFDEATLAACYKSIIFFSVPISSHRFNFMAASLSHLLALLETVFSKVLKNLTVACLPLLSCCHLMIALGTLDNMLFFRSKLTEYLSALEVPLNGLISILEGLEECDHKVDSSIKSFLIQASASSSKIFRIAIGLSENCFEQTTVRHEDGGLYNAFLRAFFLGIDQPALNFIVVPSIQYLWRCLFYHSYEKSPQIMSSLRSNEEGEKIRSTAWYKRVISFFNSVLIRWETVIGEDISDSFVRLLERYYTFSYLKHEHDAMAQMANDLARTFFTVSTQNGRGVLFLLEALKCSSEFLLKNPNRDEIFVLLIVFKTLGCFTLPNANGTASCQSDRGEQSLSAMVSLSRLLKRSVRIKLMPYWVWVMLMDIFCTLCSLISYDGKELLVQISENSSIHNSFKFIYLVLSGHIKIFEDDVQPSDERYKPIQSDFFAHVGIFCTSMQPMVSSSDSCSSQSNSDLGGAIVRVCSEFAHGPFCMESIVEESSENTQLIAIEKRQRSTSNTPHFPLVSPSASRTPHEKVQGLGALIYSISGHLQHNKEQIANESQLHKRAIELYYPDAELSHEKIRKITDTCPNSKITAIHNLVSLERMDHVKDGQQLSGSMDFIVPHVSEFEATVTLNSSPSPKNSPLKSLTTHGTIGAGTVVHETWANGKDDISKKFGSGF